MKMISALKVKIAALTAELAEYKSVRGQLHVAELEHEISVLAASFIFMKSKCSITTRLAFDFVL